MKHRSVIAFVFVAAALFAAPQISHDLQAFKSGLGARLRGELLHAFLSMPATEGTAVPAAGRTESLVASCSGEMPGASATKSRKGEAAQSPRSHARNGEAASERLGAAVELAPEVRAELSEALADVAHVKTLMRAHAPLVLREVAMIIPPDNGIEPQALARATELAAEARMAYVMTRAEATGGERKMGGEAAGAFNGPLPVGYEFRVEREGDKTKVMKVKRACCLTPRVPRAPGPVASGMPLPQAVAPFPAAGE